MIAVFLADGFEEIEAVTTIDFLRRCELKVQTVAIGGESVQKADGLMQIVAPKIPTAGVGTLVKGSHDIAVLCDLLVNYKQRVPWEQFDGVILPGGMPGTKNLEASEVVQTALEAAYQNNKLIAAICAAPSVLAHLQMLEGKAATCYPGFEDDLRDGGAIYKDEYVVEDGNIITAKGAGCTLDFAQAIAARFVGQDRSREVRESLQVPY